MPVSRNTFLLLFGIIFTGIGVLGFLSFRHNRFYEPGLSGIFILLTVIFVLILYQFRQRRKTEQKLMESEDRFHLLIEHVRDYAIFMIDPEGRVISWNQGARQIKGYTEEEVIGQPISIFYTDEENQQGEPRNNLKKAAEDGRFESVGWRKRKDGTLFCANVVFTSVYDDKGNLRGFAKITRDITEQKKAEEEIRNALQREKELNEMKSRFVTLASHEFKTPLSIILSSLSLVNKYQEAGMEENRMKHIHRIRTNVNNLRQILNDFLSIEKLEGGLVKNSPAIMDLAEFARETVMNMNEACKTGQHIELEISGNPVKVSIDEHMLGNILNNLLSNAIKYSPEYGPIGFTLQFEPGRISFTIKDCGIGIPEEDQPHLFERFFRATNTTGVSGTGLGLSIVKKYLDLMEGSIQCKSSPEHGSEFTVILPAVPVYECALAGD